MIQLFKMAYRDLGRNRRRSFFSSLALAIGLALLLLMAAVVEGEIRDSMNRSIRLVSGHLQIRAASYNEDKTSLKWEDLVEAPGKIVQQVSALPQVKIAAPRLFASGIAASGDRSYGVQIIGIDPALETGTPVQEGLLSGSFLTADDREGLLIGKPLAEDLGLQVGDSLNLLANTSNGEVDEQPFTIRGIYSTDTPIYDETTVFLPLSKAQAITRTEDHASIIWIMLNDRAQAETVAAALQGERYQVRDWKQMNSLMIEFETLSNGYMYMFYLIVLAITATVIVNTLLMAVFERTREIGILSAIGMRSGRIMAMFFAESVLLAVGGILMGLVLGSVIVSIASTYGFYIGDMGVSGLMLGERIYPYLTPEGALPLVVMTLIVTLLAALYPAVLAARLEPVAALRGEK